LKKKTTKATGGRKRPRTRAARHRPASRQSMKAVAVTAAELRALRREIDRKVGQSARWNPDPENVQKSVAQLVLTIVEFLRRLMERQAIRRMEQKTLTPQEVEAVGVALMRLEETVNEIGAKFGLAPEDLNLDLGPIGKLM
jgi:hypothetical protein